MSSIHGAQLQVRFTILGTFYSLSVLLQKLKGILILSMLLLPIGLRLTITILIMLLLLLLLVAPKATVVVINGFGWAGHQGFGVGTP